MISEKIFDAIEFANRAHREQFRKGTFIPKLVHLIGVMRLLIENNCPEDVVIAGILHDTLEDTKVTYPILKKEFGRKVVKLVEKTSEKDKSLSWDVRKQQTITHLRKAPIDVLLIVCADKIDNLRFTKEEYVRVGENVWDRFNSNKEKQKWYFESLIKVFEKRLKADPGMSMLTDLKKEFDIVFGRVS